MDVERIIDVCIAIFCVALTLWLTVLLATGAIKMILSIGE
jgi:hypothetical protein